MIPPDPAPRPYRGRFAPSPTGLLHLGSAATAVLCAAAARAGRGALVVRVEDLDRDRVVPGAAAEILDDLRWLGLAWDEGPDVGGPHAPYVQSDRTALYEAAIARLEAAGHTYLCDCSRAEIARAASAPHEGDEGPRYPGTCRALGMRPRAWKRPPAVRLAIPEGDAGRVAFVDGVIGPREEHAADRQGDFVLRRGDGVFAYQLAVVVDDLAMGITHVVRGADLEASTARQILLARLLGGAAPAYAHVPLVTGPDGARLAKRAHGVSLRDRRASGREGRDLVRAIARAYGHDVGAAPDPLGALAERLDLARLRGRAVSIADLGVPA